MLFRKIEIKAEHENNTSASKKLDWSFNKKIIREITWIHSESGSGEISRKIQDLRIKASRINWKGRTSFCLSSGCHVLKRWTNNGEEASDEKSQQKEHQPGKGQIGTDVVEGNPNHSTILFHYLNLIRMPGWLIFIFFYEIGNRRRLFFFHSWLRKSAVRFKSGI